MFNSSALRVQTNISLDRRRRPSIATTICLLALVGLFQLFCAWPAYAGAELPAVSGLMEKAYDADLSTYYDEKNSSAVLFLGGEHTFNPELPRIAVIEKLFVAFRPTLLIVEGGDWPVAQSGNEAVRKYSELGFARYLAAQHHVRAQSFDPDNAALVRFALKAHSATDVKLYLAMRLVPQWRATGTDETMRQKMEDFLNPKNSLTNFGPAMPGNSKPVNVLELDALMRSDFGADIDWRQADAHAGIAGRKFDRLLATDKTINNFRNLALRNSIVEAMRANNRVMVITGVSHLAATLQPLMQQLGEFK